MKHTSDAILKPEQARYLEALEPPRDPLLAKLERFAAERHQPISDPEVASFLAIAVRSHRAKRIVELGTNIGYGAIVMARASEGQVVTIEKSRELCETARGFIGEAQLSGRVEVREGAAIAELEKIDAMDFVYIDCVKEEYPRYFELALPRLSAGGVIVADNVLWKGLVASDEVPAEERARVEALRAFNRAIVATPGLRGVILPLGDGVAYAVKMT
ncbi:MAG TPA: O-methyltransferase [Polyangiaceae bacterium]|nr:O-methyltransferase [Polyangiaceae bacterium]